MAENEQLGDLELLNQADETEQNSDLSSLAEDEPKEEETEETEEESTEKVEDTEKEEETDETEKEPETDAEKLASERLRFKEVTSKYPNLFKDFPQLRHVFFREQEYSGLFPTVEDAKEAAQKAENYTYLEQDLLQGNPQNLLLSVAQANPQAFSNIVEQFLPTVYSMNKDAFYQVTQPILTNALRAAFNDATNSNNKNLALAAQYVNQYLFGKPEIDDTKPLRQEQTPDPERQQFEQERQQFIRQRMVEFESSVQQDVQGELTKLAMAGLDPKNELNEFTRKTIIKETLAQVGAVLQKDARHMAQMNSLWKRAMQSGLSAEHKARIMEAFIGRAKELLPQIRSKVRSEAMGISKPSSNSKTIKRSTGTGAPTKSSGQINPHKVDWNKTSDLDILNDDVKMRN